MKKIFIVMMLLCATLVASAQEVPSSFPRKYLLEHFTGDGCGNCPGGMAAMVGYTQSVSTPCIWVSHHYGYNEDEYTISESAKIAKAIAVSGAPNLGINRTKITGTAIAFHPGYLVEEGMADLIAKKCEATAEASVVITHTYDTLTRELNVTVSGQVANAEVTSSTDSDHSNAKCISIPSTANSIKWQSTYTHSSVVQTTSYTRDNI